MEVSTKKKVCIIGAGPRGLVTARHISTVENLEVTVFESKDNVGGVWLYQEANSADPKYEQNKQTDNYFKLYNCFNGSMYENLVTNLPYFFMEYKDLGMKDVDENFPIFLGVSDYLKYLKAYAERFELRKLIRFNTLVKSVRLYENLSGQEKSIHKTSRKFLVTTVGSHGASSEKYDDFDYIVVTSGQYNLPYIPEIPNIATNFKGNVLHCKDFRTPNSPIFQNKKLLLIGGGASTQDMLTQFFSSEIRREIDCNKVVVSSTRVAHLSNAEDFKPYVERGKLAFHQGRVVNIKEPNIACFSDGGEEEIDTILFATGYSFKFPFFDLEKDSIITHNLEEHRGAFFGPTYKKFLAINEPDVFFIGFLEMTMVVHIVPELQALAVKYIIEGKLEVPSKEEMQESFDKEVEEHLNCVGDLAHFYKTNLTGNFPKLLNNNELNEWKFFSEWIKPVHQGQNEAKSKAFMDLIEGVKKELGKHLKDGNYLRLKKEDYLKYYPNEFRNTSDFV